MPPMIASLSRFMLFVALLSLSGSADEPVTAKPPAIHPAQLPPVLRPVPTAGPWIGLEVSKLTEALHAQLSGVPRGVGFVVTGVDEDGPAARAGLRRFDILWKFDDQLLINEAQFGTLIQMKSAGDRVVLSIVRGGEASLAEVEIAKAPERSRLAGFDPAEIPIYPSGLPDMPRQIVYPGKRIAEVTRHDGSVARLSYEGEEALVVIEKTGGEVIYDGPVRKDGHLAVPAEWRCAVGALLRTMERASSDEWKPRQPRPRVVLPPGQQR
jgi:hypothetical protein